MIRAITYILILLFLTTGLRAKADSWIDPTWKRMLDSSDLVALVQYTSNGDFRASAKILAVYKGQLAAGNEIWISGFSNRYGPVDKMSAGEKYMVFLSLNEPSQKALEHWNGQLQKDTGLRKFVDAFKNHQAYYVWSPTSGDLRVKGKGIQYSLLQTTYYDEQSYYPLEDFETFLRYYYGPDSREDYFRTLLNKLTPARQRDENCQLLLQLVLLEYNQYNEVFSSYARIKNSSSRLALAQLMGNIKSVPSRTVLIALLDDPHSLVQGEAVRQLKKEPAAYVGPILLKHLTSSSGLRFTPANIMDPVRNTIYGGKAEIIEALGELKYTAAVPHLLLLLDTENRELFKLVIGALKEIGSKAYTPYINKHLERKTHDLIFDLSMMIAEDSLVECLPSLKNFISTCNRNKHPNYEYTVSTCCGIGHFKDSATTSFLLSDYERFFSYKDSLESSKQKYWTQNYIETFTDLKNKEARPLIYRSVYDWFGLSEEFGAYPELFHIKKQLEDSLINEFSNKFGAKGYKINHCLAFVQNIPQVALGAAPKTKFLIEATIPATGKMKPYLDTIANELNLAREQVYLRSSEGWYYIEKQERFDKRISLTPMDKLISYVQAVPTEADINFLRGLLSNRFITDKYDQNKTRDAIEAMAAQLQQ